MYLLQTIKKYYFLSARFLYQIRYIFFANSIIKRQSQLLFRSEFSSQELNSTVSRILLTSLQNSVVTCFFCWGLIRQMQVSYTVHAADFFFLIFHCGLYIRAVSNTDNLCTKQGNSSIFQPKSAGYNQERVIIIFVTYDGTQGRRKV